MSHPDITIMVDWAQNTKLLTYFLQVSQTGDTSRLCLLCLVSLLINIHTLFFKPIKKHLYKLAYLVSMVPEVYSRNRNNPSWPWSKVDGTSKYRPFFTLMRLRMLRACMKGPACTRSIRSCILYFRFRSVCIRHTHTHTHISWLSLIHI